MGAAVSYGIVAFACVVGPICCDAADFLVCRDLAEQVGQNVRDALEPVALRRSPSPMWLPVISTARTSSVSSSMPRWILRQTRRFAPPCLRACHSPSPSTLMPVLSIARQGIMK